MKRLTYRDRQQLTRIRRWREQGFKWDEIAARENRNRDAIVAKFRRMEFLELKERLQVTA